MTFSRLEEASERKISMSEEAMNFSQPRERFNYPNCLSVATRRDKWNAIVYSAQFVRPMGR